MKLFKNKKIFFGLFVLIVGISVLIYNNRTGEEILEDQKKFIKPPSITNYFDENLDIRLNFKNKDFVFPKELPYLKSKKLPRFTSNEVSEIAKNFNFDTSPIEFTDAKNGKLYIWNSEKYSLTVYQDIRTIRLTPSLDVKSLISKDQDNELSEGDYKTISLEILSSKLNLDKNKLFFSNSFYLNMDNVSEKIQVASIENSQIIQLNYSYSSTQIPIYTKDGQNSHIYIQLSKIGEVVSIEANLVSEYIEGEEILKVKNLKQIEDTIQDSVLVNLDDLNTNLPDLKSENIQDIEINDINLVYLQESTNTEILQPVFRLTGNAKTVKNIDRVSATMYLPAYLTQ